MERVFPFSQTELAEIGGAHRSPDSFVIHDDVALWYETAVAENYLTLLAPSEHPALARFRGESAAFREGYIVLRCPTDGANAAALRATLPWLQPALLGLTAAAGFGDRLGLATPGHVRALRRAFAEHPEATLAPIFAQQSMREMERTNRTPADVLDDATWGAFQAGWRERLGADADHLKTPADIDACAAVGYTFYTFDPGAYVDSAADNAAPDAVTAKLDTLPWDVLESSPRDLEQRYAGRVIALESASITLDTPSLLRAAAKYGAAIAHVATMYRHLAAKPIPCEMEVSVDETETPTTPIEHIYIVGELQRLGVRWVSLAPRYIGRFEKGIEYIGDLDALARDLRTHAAIARALGPYKLSLHSGSDKFSVYPLIHAATRGMVHLKTAGTSYVEALRVVAQVDPSFFREIVALARECYPQDRASYHVSADVGGIPNVAAQPDTALPPLMDDVVLRQVLHVTFGSVLATLGTQLHAILRAHAEEYAAMLEQHMYRHIEPFLRPAANI